MKIAGVSSASTLALCASLLLAPHTLAAQSQCRCRPNDSCWPSAAEWQVLNFSISGNLVETRPIGESCHGPAYNQAACDEFSELSLNSTWRITHPSTFQNPAWEASVVRNQSCLLGEESIQSVPCGQGRVPLFSAQAKTPEQARDAVLFARQHNLRLMIRNTGHDSQGRSSALDSFQLMMSNFKDIAFTKNFVPSSGGTNATVRPEGPAFTIGAGVHMSELRAAGAKHGYLTPGADFETVGIVGGYMQGGGITPPLMSMVGLAADMALQFEVITADGRFVTANKYQNQDLFWALRGGGGGTFGVVLSATIHAYPDIPTVTIDMNFGMQVSMNETFWNAMEQIATISRDLTSDLTTQNKTSQYTFGRINQNEPVLNVTWVVFLNGETDTGIADRATAGLLKYLDSAGVQYNYTSQAMQLSVYLTLPSGKPSGGYQTFADGILLTQDFYNQPEAVSEIMDALSAVPLRPGDFYLLNTMGGKTNTNGKTVGNAVNPAWRNAALLVGTYSYVDPSLAGQQSARNFVHDTYGPMLESIDPAAKGRYINEADQLLEDWRYWFWGAKYERLSQIKKKWDPQGLFIVRHGVGSEEWDESGNCRVG